MLNDDLREGYGLSSESIRDEIISGILEVLEVRTDGIDFKGFSFDTIESPRDIIGFIEKVDDLRDGPVGTKFVLANA